MITLRAILARDPNGPGIVWNYDNPQQAMRPWRIMTRDGATPDTGEKIIRAYYFGANSKPGDGPDKAWHA
jgi:hypothetical protein